MPEQQNIEFKASWHDDYLKWVCGFANAQGGRIYIGKSVTINELHNLVEMRVLSRIGETGRGTYYELQK